MTNKQAIDELRRLSAGLSVAVNQPEADAAVLASGCIDTAYRLVVELGGPTPPCLMAEIACQSGTAGVSALTGRRLLGLV